jgi:putative membrane fusion protein
MANKRVIRLRFYIIVTALLLGAAAGAWYFLVPAGTYTVKAGTMAYQKDFRTVIVRSEKAVTQKNYGKISFVAAEGEKVSKGTKVAEVYAWGYSDEVLQDLIDVQADIKQYQENNILKQVFEKDLQTVNSDIDKLISKLSAGANGSGEVDLAQAEAQLKTLMAQRKALLKDAVTPNEALQKLYDRENDLKTRLNSWVSDVKAAEAGTISFYFDGYETLMQPGQIDKLTRSDIDGILGDAAPQKIDVSDGTKPLYRLVDSGKWYCLIVADGDQRLQTDVVYGIAFEGFYNKPYTGRLLSQRSLEKGALYVLEINEDIGPLLSVRKANATLKKTYEGLKVPVSALSEKDGAQGVTVIRDGKDVFVSVKVVYKDNDYAVIEPSGNSPSVQANDTLRLHR